ncbi:MULTISPECIES: hypothetical protein [unclassified Delftia]|uniref:hypothetical protein n=1 Tax=unclassified Delftia TaxID=2613839 RepID=UPI0006488A04|nr:MULTISPECIES: hypothetical protein [unclassified Delftia]MDC2862335.1 hypothetical protein [Delftia sp. DT-2]
MADEGCCTGVFAYLVVTTRKACHPHPVRDALAWPGLPADLARMARAARAGRCLRVSTTEQEFKCEQEN